jgi:hypothetical protein
MLLRLFLAPLFLCAAVGYVVLPYTPSIKVVRFADTGEYVQRCERTDALYELQAIASVRLSTSARTTINANASRVVLMIPM